MFVFRPGRALSDGPYISTYAPVQSYPLVILHKLTD